MTAIAFGPVPYLVRLNDVGGNGDLAPPSRPGGAGARRRRQTVPSVTSTGTG